MHDGEGTQIIGHRGAGGHAPENTEAALLAGVRLGASALEVDVQFTSDGTPVVYHDRTLERMAGVRGKVREQTARELAGYDIGFRFGDDYRGLRILTLDEAARLVPREIALHVEIKDYDTVSSANLKEVLGSLRRRSLLDRCVLSSFSEKILSMLHGLESKARLGLLVSGRAGGAADRAAGLRCFSLHPEAGHTDRALVEECHARGLKVFPYTVNEPAQMKQLLAMGVDGIYTDFPGRLAEIVGRRPRAARGAPARGGARHEPLPRPEGAHGRPVRASARTEEKEKVPAVDETEGPQASDDVESAVVEPAANAPAEAAPDAGSGEGLPADDHPKHKRRRGRRGGRRHRRKPPHPGAAEPGSTSAESAIETAVGAPLEGKEEAGADEAGGEELLAETISDLPGVESGGGHAGEGAPDAVGATKRRRRGRRGGRRHRRGGGPKDPASGETPAGGQV